MRMLQTARSLTATPRGLWKTDNLILIFPPFRTVYSKTFIYISLKLNQISGPAEYGHSITWKVNFILNL